MVNFYQFMGAYDIKGQYLKKLLRYIYIHTQIFTAALARIDKKQRKTEFSPTEEQINK